MSKYTENIKNHPFGGELLWISTSHPFNDEDYENGGSLPKGKVFGFVDKYNLVKIEIFLEEYMGSEMFHKWLLKDTTGFLTYQEITEKITEFKTETNNEEER